MTAALAKQLIENLQEEADAVIGETKPDVVA